MRSGSSSRDSLCRRGWCGGAAASVVALLLLSAAPARASEGGVSATSGDPPVQNAGTRPRLFPAPSPAIRACRHVQSRTPGVVLCPSRLPRPILAGVPASPPPGFREWPTWLRNGAPIGVDLGYGTPWEAGNGPGWRELFVTANSERALLSAPRVLPAEQGQQQSAKQGGRGRLYFVLLGVIPVIAAMFLYQRLLRKDGVEAR